MQINKLCKAFIAVEYPRHVKYFDTIWDVVSKHNINVTTKEDGHGALNNALSIIGATSNETLVEISKVILIFNDVYKEMIQQPQYAALNIIDKVCKRYKADNLSGKIANFIENSENIKKMPKEKVDKSMLKISGMKKYRADRIISLITITTDGHKVSLKSGETKYLKIESNIADEIFCLLALKMAIEKDEDGGGSFDSRLLEKLSSCPSEKAVRSAFYTLRDILENNKMNYLVKEKGFEKGPIKLLLSGYKIKFTKSFVEFRADLVRRFFTSGRFVNCRYPDEIYQDIEKIVSYSKEDFERLYRPIYKDHSLKQI